MLAKEHIYKQNSSEITLTNILFASFEVSY
jgi:hypothetical protein